jgi:hypothetical protein
MRRPPCMQPITPHMLRVPHSKLGTHAQEEAWRSKAEGRAHRIHPWLGWFTLVSLTWQGDMIARE